MAVFSRLLIRMRFLWRFFGAQWNNERDPRQREPSLVTEVDNRHHGCSMASQRHSEGGNEDVTDAVTGDVTGDVTGGVTGEVRWKCEAIRDTKRQRITISPLTTRTP